MKGVTLKKLLLGAAVLIASAVLFAGCGKKEEKEASGEAAPAAAEQQAVTVKIGATPVPHVEILEFAKPILAEQGVNLEIITFTDYVQPNLALDKGELDANYFQHFPYLESFSADHGLSLRATAKVHIEPMGFYSAKVKSIAEVEDNAVIAIPNDPTNGGRALALLEKAGLIKLADGAGIKATVQDITENPKNITVKALDAAQLPRVLEDAAGAVINTNFALEAGLNPSKDALIIEDKDSPYSNILVVKAERANEEALVKLAEVLASPEVKAFIEEKYQGAIVPAQEVIR
ncbi:ABC transporter substrate-binding protein [Geovibrio thiophilus]|uniref:Lipoprotein n=1 Tax=Geovibrio thiophilus TaxID=139438 RepID=A0A410JZC0_9BACT|nr:MetQ/NlpA family ABC transporter substrate-binding protein [Geovibrio thiophilus]QAR33483.1 ABC transporter substrate-binding protein [Geovibrio thiophilus]